MGWAAISAGSQRVFAALQEAKFNTRVIMLTDADAREDFIEAVRQGCCGIVLKQTSTELLIKSIHKVHEGEFWLDRLTTAEVIRRLAKKGPGCNGSSRLGVRDQGAALSHREREIVVLVAQGFKNKEMAERMFISEQTVKNHLHNIFDKLGVSDRLELALYAIHHNLHEILIATALITLLIPLRFIPGFTRAARFRARAFSGTDCCVPAPAIPPPG